MGVEIFAGWLALSGMLKVAVDALRRAVGEQALDGTLVNIAAVVLGAGLLYLFQIDTAVDQVLATFAADIEGATARDLPAWANYAGGGLILGLGSAVVNDVISAIKS